MALPRRHHVLDIHVPDHRAAFGCGVDLAADEEVARLRERKRPALLRVGGRCRDHQHHPQRPRAVANSVHAFLPLLF
jgi:hypothetical protein